MKFDCSFEEMNFIVLYALKRIIRNNGYKNITATDYDIKDNKFIDIINRENSKIIVEYNSGTIYNNLTVERNYFIHMNILCSDTVFISIEENCKGFNFASFEVEGDNLSLAKLYRNMIIETYRRVKVGLLKVGEVNFEN